MANQVMVKAEGELVVLVAEGEAGKCEVRLNPDEAERFGVAYDRALLKARRAHEAKLSREAMKVHGVEDDDDPGQGVAE